MSIRVKINEKSIDKLRDQTREAFQKVIKSKQMLDEVGKVLTDDIKFQTRKGLSIPNNLGRLKPLSDRWIKDRQKIAQATETTDTYSPKRSNLSLSGQLLDSLSWRIVGAGVIETIFRGSRNPYFRKLMSQYRRRVPNKSGGKGQGFSLVNTGRQGTSRMDSKLTNEELAEYVQKVRPFIGVRDQIVTRMKTIVISYIRRSSRVLKLFE